MRTRDKGYDDYGLTTEDVERLKAFCKKNDKESTEIVMWAAAEANEEIARELIVSLSFDFSYDEMTRLFDMPIPKGDFYAYRRKCLAILKRLIGKICS